MVILDMDMPTGCDTCPLMRCGKCIPNNSEPIGGAGRPKSCPLRMAPVVKDTQNIPKNVKLEFRFKFCEMCNNCEPVINTVHLTDLYCQESEIYKFSCSHEGACNYIINQRKEIRDV